jgi:hypothetical protein
VTADGTPGDTTLSNMLLDAKNVKNVMPCNREPSCLLSSARDELELVEVRGVPVTAVDA